VTPRSTLQKHFGYSDFRPGQLDIVEAILGQQDTLAILPTGGGKSICFQVPGLILPGLTLVISPLISLMKDQVDRLNELNIPATFLNSSLSTKELHHRYQQIKQSYYKFIYIAPERLFSHSFHKIAVQAKISLVVIDEAHCISEWGDSFRPEYRQINRWLHDWCETTAQPRPIVAAFTATATNAVQEDIIASLELRQPFRFLQSFRRDNLRLNLFQCPSQTSLELALLRLVMNHRHQAGIIYTATRKAAEFVKTLFSQYSFAYPDLALQTYHGGMSAKDREQTQADFLANRCQIIAATNAFGMGVDKSDIRWVVHFQLPSSLENYYQEVGRAGRDGQPSVCYLLFRPTHLKIHLGLIENSTPLYHLRQRSLAKLQALLNVISTDQCRTASTLSYFGEVESRPCGLCDNCRQEFPHHPLTIGLSQGAEIERLAQLTQLRQKLAMQNHVEESLILTESQLCYLALLEPKRAEDCLKLPGFGLGWVKRWWGEMNLDQADGANKRRDGTICDHDPQTTF
jgi:ATP-dependent DNA helicase RecQ